MKLPQGPVAKWVGAGIVAVALGLAFWPKRHLTDVERVRRKVITMVRAAEQKDVGYLLEQVSPKFRSAEGWDKDALRSIFGAMLLRQQWVRVFLVDLQVTRTPDGRVAATGKYIFGRSEAKRLKDLAKGSVLDAREIDAVFAKEADGHFRVISAKQQPISPSQLVELSP